MIPKPPFSRDPIGALSQYGKVGLTAVGNSREEADAIFGQALEAFDREAAR